ncbi:MAG: type II toxin-antitoxin system VapC family toxin [Saprospiraceae bacterium]|nr:type II toxin-antitoxin system VapC family toxin [Saprospiraceae bacterium]MCB9324519.1 type II toxin-antitoxin system VapC family toxin [Lewinellaceae bacterium]
MSNYLLDTDICIFFLKGHQKVKEKIQEVGIANCYISEITIGELFYGAFNSEHKEKHIKEVSKMNALFDVVPIYNSLELFGQEKARLKKSGKIIPDFDLLIGVAAVQHEMIMVTNNQKHLSRFEGLEIENWVAF